MKSSNKKRRPFILNVLMIIGIISLYSIAPTRPLKLAILFISVTVVSYNLFNRIAQLIVPKSTWKHALDEYKGEHHGLGILELFNNVNPSAYTHVYTLGILYQSVTSSIPAHNSRQLSDPLSWEKRIQFNLQTVLSDVLKDASIDDVELMDTILARSTYVKKMNTLMNHLLELDNRKDLLLTEEQSDDKSNKIYIDYLNDIGTLHDEFKKEKDPKNHISTTPPYPIGVSSNRIAFYTYIQHCAVQAVNVKNIIYLDTTWNAYPLIERAGKISAAQIAPEDIDDQLMRLLVAIHSIESFTLLEQTYEFMQHHDKIDTLYHLNNYLSTPGSTQETATIVAKLHEINDDVLIFLSMDSANRTSHLATIQATIKNNMVQK